MRFSMACTALIDLKACQYDYIYDRIHIRALEQVEIGKRDGGKAVDKGEKPSSVV